MRKFKKLMVATSLLMIFSFLLPAVQTSGNVGEEVNICSDAPAVDTILVCSDAPAVDTILVCSDAPAVDTILVCSDAPAVDTILVC